MALTDCFSYIEFRFVILLRFFLRLPFEIWNKMTDPFFVASKRSLPVKELDEKNTLIAHTRLIHNKLLGCEYMWVLGICFSYNSVMCRMFSYVREMKKIYLYSL